MRKEISNLAHSPVRQFRTTRFVSVAFLLLNLFPAKLCLSAMSLPRSADISVNDIFLEDLESQTKVLGPELSLDHEADIPNARFASKNGKEVLTVFTHSGGIGAIAEFRIEYARPSRQVVRRLDNIESFQTGKRIGLGLSEADVTAILGPPLRRHSKGNYLTIEYRIEDLTLMKSEFLANYNLPIYYGIYTFRNDRLTAFQFGFEYP